MKKLITAIAVSAFAFIGTTIDAEARPHHGGDGYNTPASIIYVSGYHHGRPIYTQKYFVGYDRCDRPVYRYRTVSAPSRGYGGYSDSCDNRGYNRGGYSRYDERRSSGTRVSFSFGR